MCVRLMLWISFSEHVLIYASALSTANAIYPFQVVLMMKLVYLAHVLDLAFSQALNMKDREREREAGQVM